MKIKNIEELFGKTIKKAVMLDAETFGLMLTDNTYCSMNIVFYGETCKLELNKQWDLNNSHLRDLGVIDDVEFERREVEEQRDYELRQEKRDLMEYERLKVKYGWR